MDYAVGNQERRKKGREDLVTMIREANVSVIAIGNGTACRQTEQLIADVISDELKDLDVSYVIVNGKIVVEEGKHTGAKPGKALFKKIKD